MKNIKEKIEIIGAILFAVGFWIVLIWLLNKGCSTEPTQQTINKDSLYTIIAEKTQINDCLKNENKQIKAITDSLKALKPKVIVRYKTVYDSLLVVDSMCIQALNALHDEHTKIDSVNNQIITNQETHIMNDSHIIGNLTDIIAIQKYVITSDSVTIDELKMTVKKEKRKGKLKTILGTALGVIGGGLIGSLR
jgi:hypothetical protein